MEGGNIVPVILSFLNHEKKTEIFRHLNAAASLSRGKRSRYSLSNKPDGLYRCLSIVENQKKNLHLPGFKLEFLYHHSVHTTATEICRLLACYINYNNYYIIVNDLRMTLRNVTLFFT
jgi:hypothetical protein